MKRQKWKKCNGRGKLSEVAETFERKDIRDPVYIYENEFNNSTRGKL